MRATSIWDAENCARFLPAHQPHTQRAREKESLPFNRSNLSRRNDHFSSTPNDDKKIGETSEFSVTDNDDYDEGIYTISPSSFPVLTWQHNQDAGGFDLLMAVAGFTLVIASVMDIKMIDQQSRCDLAAVGRFDHSD